MNKEIKYGIFGDGKVEVDENGFMNVIVIVQESGLYGGASPRELRIRDAFSPQEIEGAKEIINDLNKNTDLPYYLYEAKIKIGKEIKLGE